MPRAIHLVLIGLLLCGPACKKKESIDAASKPENAGVDDPKKLARDADALARKDLDTPTHADAREWLAASETKHGGFKVSKEQMLTWTEEAYAAGATAVYVTGIEQLGAMSIAAVLVVEMPRDAPTRQRIFDWEAGVQKQLDDPPTADVGQKYLRLVLD